MAGSSPARPFSAIIISPRYVWACRTLGSCVSAARSSARARSYSPWLRYARPMRTCVGGIGRASTICVKRRAAWSAFFSPRYPSARAKATSRSRGAAARASSSSCTDGSTFPPAARLHVLGIPPRERRQDLLGLARFAHLEMRDGQGLERRPIVDRGDRRATDRLPGLRHPAVEPLERTQEQPALEQR